MISKVELFYKPVEILNQLSSEYTAEMSEAQSAFLCGLLKKHRPKKIVEIGVAAGGTTAVMLNCIDMLGLETQFYSVDLSENFYRNPERKTGYLAEECKEKLDRPFNHVLYTGKFAVERINDIGKDIDFLVLDTVHSLPGELLDFLAYFPYLKKGCVVVLHDVALQHYSNNTDSFATRILLNSVAALKYGVGENGSRNIAAFVVTDDTEKYIENVFSSLIVTWKYLPSTEELDLYRSFYNGHYPAEYLEIYDMAVDMNQKTVLRKANLKLEGFLKVHRLLSKMTDKKVYVYGCGNFGKRYYHILERCGIDLGGYIVSDNQNLDKSDKKVSFLSDVELDCEKDIIFIGVNTPLCEEICSELQRRGLQNYIFPDKYILEYFKYL